MRPLRLAIGAGRFARATGGTAALEFAIVAPLLTVLMVFGLQLVTYINAVRKVESLATSMSEMLSQAPPPSPTTTTAKVTASDIHFGLDSSLVIFPYIMKDAANQGVAWSQDINIAFSSVQFTQIQNTSCPGTDQSSCYAASVVWTTTAGNNYRPCYFPQIAMNDTSAPARTSLPRSIYGPGSLIVVDIVFNFHPTFATRFMPTMRVARSVYVQPRYVSLIDFDTTNNDGVVTKCY